MTSVPPCPYFDRLASTLIGVEEDDRTNPSCPMVSGMRMWCSSDSSLELRQGFSALAPAMTGCLFLSAARTAVSPASSRTSHRPTTPMTRCTLGHNGSAKHRVLKGQAPRSAPGWIVLMDEFERTPNASTARNLRTSCLSRSITQLVNTRTSAHSPEASCLQVPPTAGLPC